MRSNFRRLKGGNEEGGSSYVSPRVIFTFLNPQVAFIQKGHLHTYGRFSYTPIFSNCPFCSCIPSINPPFNLSSTFSGWIFQDTGNFKIGPSHDLITSTPLPRKKVFVLELLWNKFFFCERYLGVPYTYTVGLSRLLESSEYLSLWPQLGAVMASFTFILVHDLATYGAAANRAVSL